ncbi:MAG TPA: GtrA family protein [Candidatus Cybelea sp.]|nr:GtrA family protein [Candidatus Cybelea sp.]
MTVHELAHRFYSDRAWPYQLARYLSIGGFVTCVDVGSFAIFLRLHWQLQMVITASWALAVVTHFSLNKYVSFRAHDRPVQHQAVTYAIVAFVIWLTTTAIVRGSVALGAPPLLGKAVAIAFNLPVGFLGHRYLTFGRGIAATWRSLFGPRTPQ